jgi:hypothetical protein
VPPGVLTLNAEYVKLVIYRAVMDVAVSTAAAASAATAAAAGAPSGAPLALTMGRYVIAVPLRPARPQELPVRTAFLAGADAATAPVQFSPAFGDSVRQCGGGFGPHPTMLEVEVFAGSGGRGGGSGGDGTPCVRVLRVVLP